MARTVKQIVRDVQINIDRHDMPNEIISLVNDAQIELEKRHEFRELETSDATTLDTTTASNEIDVSTITDLHTIKGLLIEDTTRTWELRMLGLESMNAQHPNRAYVASGRPSFYCRVGNTVEMDLPASSDWDVTLYYIKWTGTLTETDTLPIVSSDNAVVAFTTYSALIRGWGKNVSGSTIEQWKNEAVAAIEHLIKSDKQRARPTPQEFSSDRPVPGSFYANPFIHSVR